MKLISLLITTLTLTSCAGITLNDPSQVTDQQISIYKYGIERGCKDNGISKGDPPQQVESLCNCFLVSLNKSISRTEWQNAYYFSVKHQGREEMQVMAPHLKQANECRAHP